MVKLAGIQIGGEPRWMTDQSPRCPSSSMKVVLKQSKTRRTHTQPICSGVQIIAPGAGLCIGKNLTIRSVSRYRGYDSTCRDTVGKVREYVVGPCFKFLLQMKVPVTFMFLCKKNQLVHTLSFHDTSLCGDSMSCRGGNSLCRDACARNAHGFALIALFQRLSFDSDVGNVLPVGCSVTGLQCFGV